MWAASYQTDILELFADAQAATHRRFPFGDAYIVFRPRSDQIKTAVCGFCGKQFVFEVNKSGRYPRYCSPRCKRKLNYRNEVIRNPPRPRRVKVTREPQTGQKRYLACGFCGKVFVFEVNRHGRYPRYCSEACKARRAYRSNVAKKPPRPRQTKLVELLCRLCRQSFQTDALKSGAKRVYCSNKCRLKWSRSNARLHENVHRQAT